MEKIYKPKEFSDMLGVTVTTLQRWDNEKKLIAYRNPKGRRFYTHTQYEEYMGINQKKGGKIVLYARVSNRGQQDNLKNQTAFLRQFVNAKGIVVDEVIEDIGSGLNYKRKHWNRLLDDVMGGKVSQIFITHKDRFIRFGFDWFQTFAKRFGTEIIIINQEELSPQEELIQDLIAIIHVFSCRIYGLRKYKKKIKEDKSL
jgi:putative resolvase